MIKKVIELVEKRREIKSQLDRLSSMQGVVNDKNSENNGWSKCYGIEFKTNYGAHAYLQFHKDTDLIVLLVDAAILNLQRELTAIELLLGLAEKALGEVKQLGTDETV